MTTDASGFLDDFTGPDLDTEVWVPHYLPMWSSRAASAASYRVADSLLTLAIPADQGLWCEGSHAEPLRVSGIQSGVFSGPVGSTIGQQPFRDGLLVREFQPTRWGWTPRFGRIDIRARMVLDALSMASVWMVGVEDAPERSGEICVFEVFGDALSVGAVSGRTAVGAGAVGVDAVTVNAVGVDAVTVNAVGVDAVTVNAVGGPTAAVGSGIHPFRDPALVEEFGTSTLAIDVADFHTYSADWQPGRVEFFVDGALIRTVNQAPEYPMQMMVAVFDFPGKAATSAAPRVVPELVVDWVRGS